MEAHGQASGYSTAHHAAAGLPEVTVAEQLQDLVLDSTDVSDFLLELSEYSALLAGTGVGDVDCAVTLYRRRKALTGAGNTARARSLNSIQERLGAGPCLSALQEEQTVVINDLANDPRWPNYARALLAENIRSVLAVPLVLEQGASASLNFFSTTPHNFHAGIVRSAEQYARQAERALWLAVRIGAKQDMAADLQAAMASRTVIDLAIGVIMGQQRCSQAEAFQIISRAASARNQKLRDVAASLLLKITGETVETHFDH